MSDSLIEFSAEVNGKRLSVRFPVEICWEHEPGGEPDEDTPDVPHVHSTSAYHRDYAVCMIDKTGPKL